VGTLFAGATYPLRALRLLAATPALWPYVVVPVLLNVVVGVLLYFGLLVAGFELIDRVTAGLPSGFAFFEALLQALLVILLLLVTGFVFVRFGVILGAPWYDALSLRVERLRKGEAPPGGEGGLLGALRDVVRQIGNETQKVGFAVGLGLLLLVLSIIPGLGTLLATVGGITLGTTIACLDFLDPPLSRRRLGFREKLGVVRRALPGSAGFGLVCLALVSIPFVNLFSIPVCIVAGSLYYVDRIGPQGGLQAATRASKTPTS
jgi:CysZ protein